MTRESMKSMLEKQKAEIAELTVQLQRERQFAKMLSQLAFSPKQDPERMRQLRRAASLRKICKPRRIAGQTTSLKTS